MLYYYCKHVTIYSLLTVINQFVTFFPAKHKQLFTYTHIHTHTLQSITKYLYLIQIYSFIIKNELCKLPQARDSHAKPFILNHKYFVLDKFI